ncbi:hypothetical protein H4Q26_004569 [Puccinia striiformis f. sp. tritici PST-130]|nr:hypothetical protein H4Q26_004569 [Puccinia striiformis f. sp. tritici PST-130]
MPSDMTSTLAGDSGDETIVPMINQITELQQQVEQLQHQLDISNKNLDSKLIKLNQASSDSIQKAKHILRLLKDRRDELLADDGTIAQVNIACLSSLVQIVTTLSALIILLDSEFCRKLKNLKS